MKSFGYLFFLLMLVVPTVFQTERGVFLALILLGIIFSMLQKRVVLKIHPWMFMVTLVCVCVSLFFIFWGVIHNALGALKVGTVYVIWPLVFLFFLGVLHKPEQLVRYLSVLLIGTLIDEIISLLLVFESMGIFNIGLSEHLEFLGASVGIFDGQVQFFLMSSHVLLFTLPYFLAKFLISTDSEPISTKISFLEIIALIGGVMVLILMGRRSFWVVVAMTPLIVWLISILAGTKFSYHRLIYLFVIGIIAFFALLMTKDLNITVMWENFITGFQFDSPQISASAARRKEQFDALMSGWQLNPLFGAGHGADAGDNLESSEPWAYELTYIALLFQVGAVGMLVYTGAMLWLFYRSMKIMIVQPNIHMIMIPLLTGLAAFLIANATNPYLFKFDFLWVIFLPAAFLNAYLVHART